MSFFLVPIPFVKLNLLADPTALPTCERNGMWTSWPAIPNDQLRQVTLPPFLPNIRPHLEIWKSGQWPVPLSPWVFSRPPPRPERPEKMILAVVDTLSCCPLLLVVDATESDGLAIWRLATHKKFAMKKREGHHNITVSLMSSWTISCKTGHHVVAAFSLQLQGCPATPQVSIWDFSWGKNSSKTQKNRCNSTTGSPIRMITSSSNNKSSNDDPLQQIPFHWCNAPTPQ